MKFRLHIDFEAESIEEAKSISAGNCDWGGEPPFEDMEKQGFVLKEIHGEPNGCIVSSCKDYMNEDL